MGKMSEGIALLERALHLDPSSKIVQQDLMRLQAKQKLEVQKERSLYKRMFRLDTNPTQTTPQGKPKVKLTVSHNFKDYLLDVSNMYFKGAVDVDDRSSNSSRGELCNVPLQAILKSCCYQDVHH